MKKKWVNLFLLLLISIGSKAQMEGYNYFANLDTVKAPAFYNIELSPLVNAYLKTDYSDVRIINKEGKWVPHVVRLSSTNWVNGKVNSIIDIVTKETGANLTNLVLKNNIGFVSNFNIDIKNTSAQRRASISGSDNLTNWFVIEDSVNLLPVQIENSDTSQYQINFPACNYKYFKIAINNKLNDPVNILLVTSRVSFESSSISTFLQNPKGTIIQKDSFKTSLITITQPQAYHFNQFKIYTSGTKYFYRRVDMYAIDSSSTSRKSYSSFYISNNSALEFSLPICNEKQFYLEIHNEDNLPIKIDSVITWANVHYITAYLQPGENYKLLLNNPNAVQPNFDLDRQSIDFENSILMTNVNKVLPIEKIPSVINTKKNYNWLLWCSLAAALIILLLFTKKLITEVDKKKQHDSL